jgi:hypothetical protein
MWNRNYKSDLQLDGAGPFWLYPDQGEPGLDVGTGSGYEDWKPDPDPNVGNEIRGSEI